MPLQLPCGGCLGCRAAKAKAWTLRCKLELQRHESATFNTLTYAEEKLPPTLQKRDIQLWLKRLRKEMGSARPLRFFACGEYGEQTARPHYHAILFGTRTEDRQLIEDTWGHGHTRTEPVTPARIAYTAGYCQKKIGWLRQAAEERVDPNTGEVYRWQPPFLQMSRRPGIGGHARKHTESWRLYAIDDGTRMPVPRFLHEAWKKTATAEQHEELLYEKSKIAKTITREQIAAAEQMAIKRQELNADRRRFR